MTKLRAGLAELREASAAAAAAGTTYQSPQEQIAKRRAQVEELLKSRPQLRCAACRVHALSLSRMRVKNGWAGVMFFLVPVFEEISRRSGEDVSTIFQYYLLDDLKKLIIDGTCVAREEKVLPYVPLIDPPFTSCLDDPC